MYANSEALVFVRPSPGQKALAAFAEKSETAETLAKNTLRDIFIAEPSIRERCGRINLYPCPRRCAFGLYGLGREKSDTIRVQIEMMGTTSDP